jgi:hypothetical protein
MDSYGIRPPPGGGRRVDRARSIWNTAGPVKARILHPKMQAVRRPEEWGERGLVPVRWIRPGELRVPPLRVGPCRPSEKARNHLPGEDDVTGRRRGSKEHEKRKESRDAALLKGTEELTAAGMDLESLEPSAESVSRLAGLKLPSRDAARAVACWLGFSGVAEAAVLLAEMESGTRDKELKREIRRSLFKLRQRGIAAPPGAMGASEGPARAREEDRGYLSHVDARGDLVVWYVHPERSGDYYVISGVVNHRRGLLEADAGRLARPALREMLEGTRRRFSIRLLPADAGWCDRVLHEAYKQSDSKRSPGVSRFPSFRMEISHRLPERIPCPVHSLLDRGPMEDLREFLDRSARLLDEPELSGWVLDPDWLEPHLGELQELAESPLVLNRLQQIERREKALSGARRAIFGGEARDVYLRRLEATAYFLRLDGREAAAHLALAVSDALSPDSGERVEEIPFVVALAARSFRAAEEARQARHREQQRTALIVKPGET